MRRLAVIGLLFALGIGGLASTAGADREREYVIEMYNAFGVVPESDVRVSGVNAGEVVELDISPDKTAEVTVKLSGELAVLGEDTTCSAEPQSLIAEYYIDCDSAGEELPEGGRIPADRVKQTVQPDLVNSTLREPYMDRFSTIINEFGTALAGNPERLNEAIRLGAPALNQTQEALEILARQRRVIRELNVNSNRIMGELADQRDEVVNFVQEAEELGRVSASRREDLSRNFEILDDFLFELQPMLAALERASLEQTPLLRDLRAAAPELLRLTQTLPPFNRASEEALVTLGEAGVVGRRALRKGRSTIRLLRRAGRNAPLSARMLADLLRDLDDPRRAVEIDRRVEADTGRSGLQPGRRNTMGYTGLEGLLNYLYYQTLGTNKFDQVGHSLTIGLVSVFAGPCGEFLSGYDPDTGEPGVPTDDGGTTTNVLEAADCVSWLGSSMPGINEDLGLPPYHPSVCPDGTSPEAARALCDPGSPARASGDDDEDQGRASATPRPRPGQREANGETTGGDRTLLPGVDDLTRELGSRLERGPDQVGGLLDFLLGGGGR